MDKSNSIRLKICGMRNAANIREIGALNPDYMGFIFYKNSPRFVGEDFEIPDDFSNEIKRVGVFVNEPFSNLLRLVKKHNLDFVQLHGDESREYCKRIKSEGIAVIKVFRVEAEFDFAITNEYETTVDFFLFDTKGSAYGGTGKKFDWNILNNYNQNTPFFLSGGINRENILDLNSFVGMNLHALDVNSGVEISPGRKEKSKVLSIIKKLRV
jgi:phosphoribosylanthranilate isomerase